MFKESYSPQELKSILGKTANRRGWDFSTMKTECQSVPWNYVDVVSLYLKPEDRVLDIGTGGGERFIQLSKLFKSGVGIDIDPVMIKTAQENGTNVTNVSFHQDSEKLANTKGVFDAVICRHAPFNLSVVSTHLKKGGYFIIQKVGEKNMLNIKEVLRRNTITPALTKEQFEISGFNLVAFMEYNVEYVVKDVESLIFWLNALDMLHSDLPGAKALENSDLFNKILKGNVDQRGFITNEQRYLAIAQK
jgi:SAM-dependent methyltransferase